MKAWIAAIAVVGMGLGCSSASVEEPSEGQGQLSQAASTASCHCKPMHCPKGAFCKFACQPIGNCEPACSVLMLCIEGYTFDGKACRCVPSGGGVRCGSGACGAGQVCCNDSCGICTAPGEACIDLYCASPL